MIETETAPNPALMDLPRYVSEIYIISLYVLNKSGDPMDCSAPGSSVHGVFQARVLEWGAIASSSYMRSNNKCCEYCGNTPLKLEKNLNSSLVNLSQFNFMSIYE